MLIAFVGIGPMLGALLAVGFYDIMKFLHYEDVRGDAELNELDEQMRHKTRKDEGRAVDRV